MECVRKGVHSAARFALLLSALPLFGCNDSANSATMAGSTTGNIAANSSTQGTAWLVLAGAPPTEATAGVDYSFQPLLVGDNGTVVFTISGKPDWLGFDANSGLLSGRPTDADVGTSADITITATAALATGTIGPFQITVKAAAGATLAPTPTNTAPTISGTPATTAALNQAYSFTPVAGDAEGNPLSFSIVNRPSWASFDTTTGLLSGIPTAGSESTYNDILIRVSDGNLTAALPAFSITVPAASSRTTGTTSATMVNSTPTISGQPMTAVAAGSPYNFTPSAADANGDSLVYSVQNLPRWATFSSVTGRIQGTPQETDAGTYANIIVSVSDGQASTMLPAFSIAVIGNTSATGTAVLSWTPPAQNTDGSILTDLAGYYISWGTDPNNLPNSMDLAWAGYLWMQATNLTKGVWYFSIRSYNSAGVESPAIMVSKTIL